MTASANVRAVVMPVGSAAPGEYAVSFTLSNPTDQAIELATYYPFVQFGVTAAAGGAALSVGQPALDLPLNKKPVTVPAKGTVELASPIKLHFGEPPSTDPFTWSIAHAPAGVELTFTLQLPAPFAQPATTKL